jgi:hypothetical protein
MADERRVLLTSEEGSASSMDLVHRGWLAGWAATGEYENRTLARVEGQQKPEG